MEEKGMKGNGIKANGIKADGIEADEIKGNGIKQNGIEADEIKGNGIKQNEIEADEIKGNGIKQNEIKANGIKANGIKEEIKKDENQKDEIKKDGKMKEEWPKELVCIRCPIGCMITVSEGREGELDITGNTCNRGAEYAKKELTDPTRIVTSTVRVRNGKQAVVSVKTREDIPKGKIRECMDAIKCVELEAPVHIGDVALANVAGTGVDMVVTKNA